MTNTENFFQSLSNPLKKSQGKGGNDTKMANPAGHISSLAPSAKPAQRTAKQGQYKKQATRPSAGKKPLKSHQRQPSNTKLTEKANTKLLKDLCHLFLHFMKDTKTASDHTLKAYKTDLYEWFDIKKQKKEALLLTRPKFVPSPAKNKALKQSLQNCMETDSLRHFKQAVSSRNRKTASIRSFIKWLRDQDYIDEDFRFLFKTVKTVSQIPFFLSVDEIRAILEIFNKKNKSPAQIRDKALFLLLYGGGLRISEACRIKIKDIDFSHHNVRVKGKGNRERMIPLPKKVFPSLKQLSRLCEPGQIFLFGNTALPERKAYDIVRAIGQKAGILKPLHPHALRHSFATHILTGGADIRILQELLGHKSLSSTQKYTHLDLNHLSATLEKRHPLYQKKQN